MLGGILLQTAKARISGEESPIEITTRLLFDSGSRRSYITEKLKDELNLKSVRKTAQNFEGFWPDQ